jgi:nitroreductase
MNETIQTILNRRSVRVFSDKQIDKNELTEIIKSGLYAPSAHNQQPWHFTVVQDKALIDELNLETKIAMSNHEDPTVQQYGNNEKYHIFYNSPTIIVISGENSALVPKTDCAAATQNMLIAAESLNIGSCWIGLLMFLFQSEKASEYIKKLEIPANFTPYYAISLGYKKIENSKAPQRREDTVNFL